MLCADCHFLYAMLHHLLALVDFTFYFVRCLIGIFFRLVKVSVYLRDLERKTCNRAGLFLFFTFGNAHNEVSATLFAEKLLIAGNVIFWALEATWSFNWSDYVFKCILRALTTVPDPLKTVLNDWMSSIDIVAGNAVWVFITRLAPLVHPVKLRIRTRTERHRPRPNIEDDFLGVRLRTEVISHSHINEGCIVPIILQLFRLVGCLRVSENFCLPPFGIFLVNHHR